MTETSTETELENMCANCGAEIRTGSQFCYGCGKPVAVAGTNIVEFPIRGSENNAGSNEDFLSAAADAAEEDPDAKPSDMPEGFLVPEEAPSEETVPAVESKEREKSEQLPGSLPPEKTRSRERRRKNGKLETAASIQKRERLRVKRPDEVVWDTGDPTPIFAIVAVALLIISSLIFYFAVFGK